MEIFAGCNFPRTNKRTDNIVREADISTPTGLSGSTERTEEGSQNGWIDRCNGNLPLTVSAHGQQNQNCHHFQKLSACYLINFTSLR